MGAERADDIGPANDPRQGKGQAAGPLRIGGRLGAGRRRIQHLDRRYEGVAPAGHIHDVAAAKLAVTQRPAQPGDVDPKVALLDERIRPHAGDQVILADDLPGSTDQGNEDVQGASADRDLLFALEQELLRRQQTEWAKYERLPGVRRVMFRDVVLR